MIQFNLLPDIKLEYIKANRIKRSVIAISIVVGSVALAIFVFLFLYVNVAQKQHLSDLQKDIDSEKKTLQGKTDLGKILTIQNQLNSLSALHDQKPVTSRIFGFIQQLTPTTSNISSLNVNWEEKSIRIDGTADSLVAVNTFVDTIKFTNLSVTPLADQSAQAKTLTPFSEVVLDSFTVASATTNGKKPVAYSIKLKYDPALFSSDNIVKLQTPGKITTRSETEKPATIFQTQPVTTEGQ